MVLISTVASVGKGLNIQVFAIINMQRVHYIFIVFKILRDSRCYVNRKYVYFLLLKVSKVLEKKL